MAWLVKMDKAVFEYLTLYVNPPWLQAWSEQIGDLGNYLYPVIAFCVLYYWLNSPRFIRFFIFLALLLVCSETLSYLLKNLVARPRPAVDWLIYTDARAWGFPSAHAVNSMALACFAARWFNKSIFWYLPIPGIIGVSRIFANYHYPLDIFGGWVLGWVVAHTYWSILLRRTSSLTSH